ncbi:cation efflux protein [Choiromyces venosus 120613-1]|uniref:Cation efflux protein n=1 Tax=Choiromyces venosus 120613-1 TaxID=1336337 RepID=A0A3N4IVW0_9PEZI|nr:cation efflux protein [Choiromyces venosus 120613-1]
MAFSRSARIITLLVIDSLFFLLEIIVGYSVHSLALVADSFHMLNDVFSLLVALWAIKLAKQKSTSSYTYGWQRAEVLGALINGVFLLALCLSIFLEAIQRFFEPREVSSPWLVFGVGSAGLVSNILGLFLFHDHSHSHGGDSHDHDVERGLIGEESAAAGHEHHKHTHGLRGHIHDPAEDDSGDIDDILPDTVVASSHTRAYSRSCHQDHNHAKPKEKKSSHSHHNLNMRGVFLHVLGDALGNVGVMSVAGALLLLPETIWWRHLLDPSISLLITIIIFSSALPLCKSASKILLQGVPKGISLEEVKEDIASIQGVESVHELHIWQLSDVKMIASLHIQIAFDPECEGGGRYMQLANAVRTCLHAYGIHSSTIQPEYTKEEEAVASRSGSSRGSAEEEAACLLECGDGCVDGKCCPGGAAPGGEVIG